MSTITREQLFTLFKTDIHPQLEAALDKATITGLAVYENTAGKRQAIPTHGPTQVENLDDGFTLIAVYHKPDADTPGRTMAALAYLAEHPDTSVYAAAKRFGITPTAIHRAIKRREGKVICPCCGQVVRDGFVLTNPQE